MRITDIARRASHSLRQSKARTILTSLAIAVGAFTVTLALAGGAGMRDFTDKMLNDQTDQNIFIVYSAQEQGSAPQGLYPEYDENFDPNGKGMTLTNKDIAKISGIDGVKTVAPDYSVSTKYIQIDGGKKYAVGVSQYNPGKSYDIVSGTLNKDTDLQPDEITLPQEFVETAGYTVQNILGKTVGVRLEKSSDAATYNTGEKAATRDFKVVAVTKQPTSNFSANVAPMVSMAAAKSMYTFLYGQEDSYSWLNVYIQDTSKAEAVRSAITGAGAYEVSTAQDMRAAMFDSVNAAQYVVAGFGAIAILAAVFGIVNTQYVSVLQRTRQIGLMKALGARRRDIGRLFRLEAGWIGFLGAIIGLTLAIVVALIANPFLANLMELEKGTKVLIIEPLTALALVVGLILIAVLAGILPARKAAKMDPVEALRTE